MAALIEERIKLENKENMTSLIISDYYEIIKELITAILLLDGYKTLSHKDLIDYLKEKYLEFSQNEISVLHKIRTLRNRIVYEGFLIESHYLNRNEDLFKLVIEKLKKIIKGKFVEK